MPSKLSTTIGKIPTIPNPTNSSLIALPAVLHNDEFRSPLSHGATSEDSDWTTADNNTIPEKHMNSLSPCESTTAADDHLTLVEIMDCFYQVF